MALLPEDPKQQQQFLVTLLALAAVAGYYMYLYQPKGQELTEMEDRLAELQHHNRMAEARTGNLDGLREDLNAAERLFAALEELVPSRAEVPEIYQSIATESEAARVNLVNVVPSTPQREEDQYYLRQTWDMTVSGSYHSIGRLLTRVASFRRIVRPKVRTIEPAAGGGGQGSGADGTREATASFQLETYVLPPDTLSTGEEGEDASGS